MMADDVWAFGQRWMFLLSVPWLTHRSPRGVEDLQRFFADQIIFLSALATTSSFSDPEEACTLQLRYSVPPGGNRALRCSVIGAASQKAKASELLEFAYSAMPRGLPLDVVGEARARATIYSDDVHDLSMAEIRRAVLPVPRRLLKRDPTEAQPDRGGEEGTERQEGEASEPPGEATPGPSNDARDERLSRRTMLIPWQWTHSALEATLSAMSRQKRASTLVVNVGPAQFTNEDRRVISRSLGSLASIVERDRGNVLADALLVQYLAYQREMHGGCLTVRVVLCYEHASGSALAHVTGSDLASGGLNVPGMAAYEVRTPRNRREYGELRDVVTLVPHDVPREERRDADRLIWKFPALEANVAFRFPIFAKDLVIADW